MKGRHCVLSPGKMMEDDSGGEILVVKTIKVREIRLNRAERTDC